MKAERMIVTKLVEMCQAGASKDCTMKLDAVRDGGGQNVRKVECG